MLRELLARASTVQVQYPDGGGYVGELNQSGDRDGFGCYEYAHGDAYVGEWVGGEFSGKGVYMFKEGAYSIYDGHFKAGNRDGNGTYYYDDGGIYEGEWRKN